jgi:hypothetical protein
MMILLYPFYLIICFPMNFMAAVLIAALVKGRLELRNGKVLLGSDLYSIAAISIVALAAGFWAIVEQDWVGSTGHTTLYWLSMWGGYVLTQSMIIGLAKDHKSVEDRGFPVLPAPPRDNPPAGR